MQDADSTTTSTTMSTTTPTTPPTTTTTPTPPTTVYETLGKDLVFADQGAPVSLPIPFFSSGECAAHCDAVALCNSFVKCGDGQGTCWLKFRAFMGPSADEATQSGFACTSFYAPGKD